MIERYQHCIFICSNYTAGTRNGLHYLFNESNLSEVMNLVNRYVAKEGVSIYFVVTDNPTIESVKNKDRFYNNIDILEGSDPVNVIKFNNSINNQISVMDVALLLLSRQKMTVLELKTYLFYIYCLYAQQFNSFPFKEKCYFDKQIIGFRAINNEFNEYEDECILRCMKENIIMSKFFNTEKGVELMNEVLKLFYTINKFDIGVLNNQIGEYFAKCCHIYKNKDKRYPFVLTKKAIKKLNINI